MNIEKLRKGINSKLRLRPAAISVQPDGGFTSFDDAWTMVEVTVDGIVELINPSTGHIAKLGSDHIHHFDSDPPSSTATQRHGFLVLRVQVFMQGPRLWVEPIVHHRANAT